MNAYGQHQAFVNDRWMAAYAKLLDKAKGSTNSAAYDMLLNRNIDAIIEFSRENPSSSSSEKKVSKELFLRRT
jgi:hypothetical protein